MTRFKVLVVTSHGASEPRGLRHAVAAKRAFPNADVEFLYFQPDRNRVHADQISVLQDEHVDCQFLTFPTREQAVGKWLAHKLLTWGARIVYATTGVIPQAIFSERTIGLTRVLARRRADLYFAHNFETLMPAALAAKRHGAALVFDCMEFYSDMGDGQRAEVGRAIAEIEARYLPECNLVVAASPELAATYAATYGIDQPIAAYNTPPIEIDLPLRKGGTLNLYWRNTVLGFGQRGLDDILAAMARLPKDVVLHLQGHLGHDGGAALNQRIAGLEIADRVVILPPHPAGAAVTSAARFDIGLCLERSGPRNHELTVSNKMFDYHMAGLAVIAADHPGLAAVVGQSGGGLLYAAGNVQALFDAIAELSADRKKLAQLQQNARAFALQQANMEVELDKIAEALRTNVSAHANNGGHRA